MADKCPHCNSKFFSMKHSHEYNKRVQGRAIASVLTLGLASALPGRVKEKGNRLYTCDKCKGTWEK